MRIAKFENDEKFLEFKTEDFEKHIYAIGRTGMGKSTLLYNLTLQLILEGHGLCLLDPHGDLANDILDTIPKHRTNDVIYLDMSDDAQSVGFDPFKISHHHLLTSFKDIWKDIGWGARLEWLLLNTLGVVREKHLTLRDVSRLLYEKQFRQRQIETIEDTSLRDFWHKEYPANTQKYNDEAKAPILNKVGQFMAHPKLRATLLQAHPKLNFARAIFERKIIVVNLNKQHIGNEPASLLGSLIISSIKAAAMQGTRTPFYLIADEFQTFGTSAFAEILSEARKFNLRLILAHQFLTQIDDQKVRDAILGNVSTIIAFQIGILDAKILAPQFDPRPPSALSEQFEHYALLKRNTTLTVDPIKTLPKQPFISGRRSTVIKESRQSYARPIVV